MGNRTFTWTAVVAALLMSSACSDDDRSTLPLDAGPEAEPTFGQASWLVRCPETDPPAGCINGPAHEVAGFNDDEGISVSCTVEESGGTRTLDFRITDSRASTDLSTVTGTGIIFSGGSVSSCAVEVREGGNTYRAVDAQCGGGVPSEDQPCQVRNVAIDERADPRPKITAQILCRGIVDPANPTMLRRDVTGASPGDAATFEFDGCDGDGL